MTAIEFASAEALPEVSHTGDTSYIDVATLDAADLEVGGKYLIVVRCVQDGNQAARRTHFRLAVSGAEFDNSEQRMEPTVTTGAAGATYNWVTVYTVPDPAVDIVAQMATGDASWTVRIRQCTMLAIRLDWDLTEGSDYVTDEDTVQQTLNFNTWTDYASITWTPTAGDWLIFGQAKWLVDGLFKTNFRLRLDGTAAAPNDTGPEGQIEGKDPNEERCFGGIWPVTLDGSEHTIAFQMRDTTSGVQNKHQKSIVFALRLDAFAAHASAYTAGVLGNDTVMQEAQTVTVEATGPAFIFATAICNAGSVSNIGHSQVQADGVNIQTDMEVDGDCAANDATDDMPTGVIAAVETLAGSTKVDLDVRATTAAPTWRERGLSVITVELAGGGGSLPLLGVE
jgi:hypothetical protein